jgi:FKBP-type peptidyl-prolyl cis-trans isomerase
MTVNLAKKTILGAAVAAMLLSAGCKGEAKKAPAAEVTLDTVEKKVTYIVGYNMSKQAQSNGLSFDKAVMAAAIEDVSASKEPRIAQEEQQKIMTAFQEEQQKKRDEEHSKAAAENKVKSEAFLAENAKKEGVVTTASGLQYKVIKAAEDPKAAKPTAEDVVKVHYHGTLIDGSVFDSSVDRGEPVSFPVKGVIKGWVEALQLMKVGEKFELYISPELGYGEAGTSGKIGPNATLIFSVELLEINPKIEGHGDAAADPHAQPAKGKAK